MDTQAATNESNSNIGEDPTDLSEEMTNCNQDTVTTASENPDSQQQQREHTINLVYNILSPHTISWTNDVLPALHHAGLSFSAVSTDTWLQSLRSLSQADPTLPSSTSSSHHTHNGDTPAFPAAASDPDQNPALKLMQYYEDNFGGKDEERDGRVEFDIEMAKRDSAALRGAGDVVKNGLMEKMVNWWMERWDRGCEGPSKSESKDKTKGGNQCNVVDEPLDRDGQEKECEEVRKQDLTDAEERHREVDESEPSSLRNR
ncbi:MAG: hypothetical protein Q9169_008704 [Polycauliona sp. 2 TL-2023]